MRAAAPLLLALVAAGCGKPDDKPAPVPTQSPVAAQSPSAPLVTPRRGQEFSAIRPGALAIEGTDTNYTIRLPTDVLFDFDRAELRAEAEPMLREVLNHLRGKRVLALQVYGHTDAKGDDQYNYRLSLRRARAVCEWLKREGSTYTLCLGRGEDEPVRPNANPDGSDNPENRQLNRRVEIKIALAPDAKAMIERARAQAGDARR